MSIDEFRREADIRKVKMLGVLDRGVKASVIGRWMSLTESERKVMLEIGAGATMAWIAGETGKSDKTIHAQKKSAFEKMGFVAPIEVTVFLLATGQFPMGNFKGVIFEGIPVDGTRN